MRVFKERAWVCDGCGRRKQDLAWESDPVPVCPEHGPMHETAPRISATPAVHDDQIEGGPRFFETFGHEPVWIDSKSEWRRQVDKHQVVNVVRHDNDYYAKRRKWHDEELRETGRNKDY